MERLRARTQAVGDCWLWLGGKSDGYGMASYNGKYVHVHRIAYALAHGHFPAGKPNELVLHDCNNPACVNPAHLRLGTQVDNIRQAMRDGRMPTKKPAPPRKYAAYRRLTPAEVDEARRSTEGAASLAKRFGVSYHAVYRVMTHRTYRR